MPTVFLPTMLRSLTGGDGEVEADGSNVREIVADLERRFPGLSARLTEGDRLRSNLAVAIDGEVAPLGLLAPVEPGSEVHFVPAISGGRPRGALAWPTPSRCD